MSKQETYIDKSLLHGDGKRWANLFPENEIGDFNAEGFDSVPSLDFDYPHGGAGKPKEYVESVLPPVIDRRSEADKERANYFFETDEESERKQDAYLKKYGI